MLEKATQVCAKLDKYRLIRYQEQADIVSSTDMGRICSNYYVDIESMNLFLSKI